MKKKKKKESSKILHQLGVLYQKKDFSSKLCLIQSAALLAAAQVRNPINKNIQSDLESLWSFIASKRLDESVGQNFSLHEVTNKIKDKVTKMRDDAQNDIEKLPRIDTYKLKSAEIKTQEKQKASKIKLLQEKLTESYIKIMQDVAKKTLTYLGELPFSRKFALIGMGSLAKKEITPYSDFESAILIEDEIWFKSDENREKILKYFEWFAVIFQIILISLGETLLPRVAIPCLNNFSKKNGNWFCDSITTNGISSDGFMPHACKTPLGRQERTKNKPWQTSLIKPVSEMLKYLTLEETLKNGYHLADMLLENCFVFGDERLYNQFNEKAKAKEKEKRSNYPRKYSQILNQQVSEDKIKYNISKATGRLLVFDELKVKQFFYRSLTIFIPALAKQCECNSLSSFEILSDLKGKNVLSEKEYRKLFCAVAISCEVRLKFSLVEANQMDEVNESLDIITNKIGNKQVVEYITTTHCFQKALPDKFVVSKKTPKIKLTDELLVKRAVILNIYFYGNIKVFKRHLAKRKMKHLKLELATLYVNLGYASNSLSVLEDFLMDSDLHHHNRLPKQKNRYKLRKRNYNHITTATLSKQIRLITNSRQLCRKFIQAFIEMWKKFCKTYEDNMKLKHIVKLEPNFIDTNLKRPITLLKKLLRTFRLEKAEHRSLQLNNALFVLVLFSGYTALQDLLSEWNDDIKKMSLQHKKLRSAKIKKNRLQRAEKKFN